MDISRYIGMFLAGTLMIIVALVLFPPLNGATDRLYTKFTDHCESANGTGFTKAYVGVSEFSGVNPTNQFETGSRDYSVGGGGPVTASVTGCQVASFTAGGITAALTAASIYNERGRVIFSGAAVSDAGVVTAITAADLAGYKWVRVPSLFEQFNSLNTTIISLLPVVVVASYVILAGVGLAQDHRRNAGYGQDGADLGGRPGRLGGPDVPAAGHCDLHRGRRQRGRLGPVLR